VPLLCSGAGSGFQAEGAHPVERRVAQCHAVERRPPVDDVTALATLLVEAWKDVVRKVRAEGPTARVPAMPRTGAAPLRTAAPPSGRQTQLIEHTGEGKWSVDMSNVDKRRSPSDVTAPTLSVQAAVTTGTAGWASGVWPAAWSVAAASCSGACPWAGACQG
jgi:hypothetical protein